MSKKLITLITFIFLWNSQLLFASASPELVKNLLGTWTYAEIGTGAAIRGTLVFEGLTSGTIYDNKYGKGTFSGKFIFGSSNHFSGTISFPSADIKHKSGKIWFYFFKSSRFPYGWTFKGGTEWKGANGMAITTGTRIK
jgi:hypothetical protein